MLIGKLTTALKPYDFKRDASGTTFYHQQGELVHIINLQANSWNQGNEGKYYVNVAVFYAPAYAIEWGNPAPDNPKEYHGQLRNRVKDAHRQDGWSFTPGTQYNTVADQLTNAVVTRGISFFEGIDTPEQLMRYIGNHKKDAMATIASHADKAIILALLGDTQQAQAELNLYFEKNKMLEGDSPIDKHIKRRYLCIAQKAGLKLDFEELAGETCVGFYVAMKGKQLVNDERRTRNKLETFLSNLEKKGIGYIHSYGELRRPGAYRLAFCTKDPAYVTRYIAERKDKLAYPLQAVISSDDF